VRNCTAHCVLTESFFSNPRGNSEGWSGQRYGHFMEFEASSFAFLESAGLPCSITTIARPGHHARSSRVRLLSVKNPAKGPVTDSKDSGLAVLFCC
jgi:hypothetical protein